MEYPIEMSNSFQEVDTCLKWALPFHFFHFLWLRTALGVCYISDGCCVSFPAILGAPASPAELPSAARWDLPGVSEGNMLQIPISAHTPVGCVSAFVGGGVTEQAQTHLPGYCCSVFHLLKSRSVTELCPLETGG